MKALALVLTLVFASASFASEGSMQGELVLKGSEIKEMVEFIKFFEATTAVDTEKYYDQVRKNYDRRTGMSYRTKVSGNMGLIVKGNSDFLQIKDKTYSCHGIITTSLEGDRMIFKHGNTDLASQILSSLGSIGIGTISEGLRSGQGLKYPTVTAYRMNRLYHAIKTSSGEFAPLFEVLAFPGDRSYALIYTLPQTEQIAGFELVTFGNSNEEVLLSNSPENHEAEREMKSSGNKFTVASLYHLLTNATFIGMREINKKRGDMPSSTSAKPQKKSTAKSLITSFSSQKSTRPS